MELVVKTKSLLKSIFHIIIFWVEIPPKFVSKKLDTQMIQSREDDFSVYKSDFPWRKFSLYTREIKKYIWTLCKFFMLFQ